MIRKIVILIVLTSLIKTGVTQENTDITGMWTNQNFPTTKYLFESNGKVTYYWINDLGSISRKGSYTITKDTIDIKYEVLFNVNNLHNTNDDTLSIYICNNYYAKMPYYKCLVKYKDSKKMVQADSNGRLEIIDYHNIDSIYLDHTNRDTDSVNLKSPNYNYNNQLYAFGKKDIPTNNVNLVVYKWSITRKLAIVDKKLLILDEKQIFDGINYDPSIIYIGKMMYKVYQSSFSNN
jgi:hypothetical protein